MGCRAAGHQIALIENLDTRSETVVTGIGRNTLAIALVIIAGSGASAAERTAYEQRACEDDALSLCLSEVPNIDRITACMERNLDRLSPPCRTQFEMAREGSPRERDTPGFTHRASKEN